MRLADDAGKFDAKAQCRKEREEKGDGGAMVGPFQANVNAR